MDSLQDYEVDAIIKNIPYTDINSWEQCRLQVYIISQLFAKQKADIKDVLRLPWDNIEEEHKTTISNEEIDELEELANKIKKEYYGN